MVLTTSIGPLLSANKKKRMQIFSELYEFNEQLILTLKFTRASIDKIAGQFKYIPDILAGKELISGDEGQFLRDYVLNLGKTDALSQVDYLSERKLLIKKYKDDSYSDYKKYSSLYVKIFFLIGVMIAVLLA